MPASAAGLRDSPDRVFLSPPGAVDPPSRSSFAHAPPRTATLARPAPIRMNVRFMLPCRVEGSGPSSGTLGGPDDRIAIRRPGGCRTVVVLNDFPALVPFGWGDHWLALLEKVAPEGAVPGRVVRHDAIRVVVAMPEIRSLPVRTGLESPVVGDWVAVVDDVVEAVLPRRSLLRRSNAEGERVQSLAANIDTLFVVCGLDRPVREGRLQRAVALAWDAGATPVVVLTKADLVADPAAEVAAAQGAVTGVEVVVVSVPLGVGVRHVRDLARDRTVVMLGESGAGKSTLVNALVGEEVAATGDVRSGDAKGRHTTTTRQLHPLPGGGVLLDSPGIRGVGLWVEPEAVDAVFPEIESLIGECRFGDCAHQGDLGCAVAAAVENGVLTQGRVDAWEAMRREALATNRTDQDRSRYGRRHGRSVRDGERFKRGSS